MASNVLPLFWHLASSSRGTRLGASADLVSAIETFQLSYQEEKAAASDDEDENEDEADEEDDDESGMEVDGSDDEDEEVDAEAKRLDAALARNNSPDVVYTVKRLVRGLASSRESSRLGFAVALTELLARVPTVSAAQVLSLLRRSSQWNSGMKGAEERGMMFARLFGITALVDSGALFASNARLDDFKMVIDQLIILQNAKEWLTEAAGWGLLRAAEGVADSSVEWKSEALQYLTEKFFADKTWTPEKVALALTLSSKAPELNWKALTAPVFKHTPLLASQNLPTLGRVLKEGGVAEEDASVARAGTYKPQVHYVWDVILSTYFKDGKSDSNTAPFAEFFRVVVDETLFANQSSPERKYWGFQVFERALPLLPASSLPLVFTPNFMRTWMNNLSSSDRHLHKAAVSAARLVQDHVKESPSAGFTLLSQLVGKHGGMDFDRITKTKTVDGIMANLSAEGVAEYVTFLEKILLGEESKDTTTLEDRRVWALDQMLALVRNGAVPKTDEWVSRVLDFLLVHGFFIIRKADKKSKIQALHTVAKPPFSEATAAVARARFASALVEVTAATPAKDSGRVQGADSKGKLWLSHALESMTALEADKKHVEVVSDADDEIKSLRTQAFEILKTLKTKDSQTARGAVILLSFLILQTYDEVDDALDNLEDTVSACRDLFKDAKSDKKKRKSAGADEVAADVPPPIDALLDVLIALLDKSSADLRALANLIFGMISTDFTASSIQHLVAQLEQSAVVAEAEDDAEEEDEDDEDDEEDDSASDAESDASDVSVESDDDGSAAVDPEFRKRVAEALQVSGMAVDEDEDEDSDDESVWDDEQMMKVDEQLAAVFKSQASSKKSDLKHATIESLHFKNRILDFFDSFGRRQSDSPVVLEIILPLLRLARQGGELGNKAAGIIRQRLGKAGSAPATTAVDEARAKAIIAEVHSEARSAPSAEFSGLCSAAALFLARCAPVPSSEAYAATLKDFMTRKGSEVHAAFVAEYVKRHPARAWSLAKPLLEYATDAVKGYRQSQAFAMLSTLVTNIPQLVKSAEVSKEDAERVLSQAAQDGYDTLEAAADGKAEWKADRLKEVLKFMLVVARSANTLDKARASEIVNIDRLSEVSSKVENGKTKEMKGVISLLGQLASVLGQKEKKEKRKVENGGDEEPKAKKRKAVAGEKVKSAKTKVKKAKA